jgi:HK97 family phage prohead protease
MENNQSQLLVIDGGAVKTGEDGVVEGMGIVFTSEEEPDRSKMRDFFTKESVIRKKGEKFEVPLYYNHGMGPINEEVGTAILTKEDSGWKAVAKIDTSDELGQKVYEAVKDKPHGFSTGALQHLVKREPKSNNTNFLKRWVVGEISLTEFPAEPKAIVEAIKSIDGEIVQEDAWPVKSDKKEDKQEETPLVALYNEKGEKVWDVDNETLGKFIELAGESKCGGYSYISVNEENSTITVSPDADIQSLIDNLQNTVTMLQSFSGKHLADGLEGRLIKKIEELSKLDTTKVSELEGQLTKKEEELADLRTQLSSRDEALTIANKEIAQLKVLAGANETIKNAKV